MREVSVVQLSHNRTMRSTIFVDATSLLRGEGRRTCLHQYFQKRAVNQCGEKVTDVLKDETQTHRGSDAVWSKKNKTLDKYRYM